MISDKIQEKENSYLLLQEFDNVWSLSDLDFYTGWGRLRNLLNEVCNLNTCDVKEKSNFQHFLQNEANSQSRTEHKSLKVFNQES